jgi:hypothetical protein
MCSFNMDLLKNVCINFNNIWAELFQTPIKKKFTNSPQFAIRQTELVQQTVSCGDECCRVSVILQKFSIIIASAL